MEDQSHQENANNQILFTQLLLLHDSTCHNNIFITLYKQIIEMSLTPVFKK